MISTIPRTVFYSSSDGDPIEVGSSGGDNDGGGRAREFGRGRGRGRGRERGRGGGGGGGGGGGRREGGRGEGRGGQGGGSRASEEQGRGRGAGKKTDSRKYRQRDDEIHKKERPFRRTVVLQGDFSDEWSQIIEENKHNAPVLAQLLDVLRTGVMDESPQWLPPPLAFEADNQMPMKREKKYKYDPATGKAVRLQNIINRTELPYPIDEVQFRALDLGYTSVVVHERARVLCFERGDKRTRTWERVNVYYTTGTIGTCIFHPRQGFTQKFRRGHNNQGCTFMEVVNILANPRSHLGYAYTKRTGLNGPDAENSDTSSVSSFSSVGASTDESGSKTSFQTQPGLTSSPSKLRKVGGSPNQGDNDSVTSSEPSVRTQKAFGSSTAFQELIDEFSDSDSDSDIDKESVAESHVDENKIDGMQSRYLELKIVCYMTETFRSKAMQAMRDSSWQSCADNWQNAYDILLDVVAFVDEYSIILQLNKDAEQGLTSAETPIALAKLATHNIQVLMIVLQSASILLDHTQQEREKAEKMVRTRLARVEEELAPHLQSRDAAKFRMGEQAWTSNTSPKLTYVELRKDLEQAARVLRKCRDILEQVNMAITKTGTGRED